jgi:hypothetical protein
MERVYFRFNFKKYKKVNKKRVQSLLLPALLFAIVGFSSHNTLQAQETDALNSLRIVGKAQISAGDIIADRDDNRDINGNLTAGLRIKTDLTGLQFRSNNGIHKTQQLPGATLLYLSTNERVVTIYKEGYPPFQLILNEQGIDLEKGKVWEIQVTGDQKAGSAPVRFQINPEDASLIIDGEEFKVSGTVFEKELAEGKHFIQIRKPRHEFVDDSIDVSVATVNSFNYRLKEINPIPITITSTPSGASVTVNNELGSRGTTPITFKEYPGNLKIQLSLAGYSRVIDEINFTGETTDFNYNLQEYIGYLSANISPKEGLLLVDGKIQNTLTNIRLTPGVYSIEARAAGYDAQTRNITVAQGDSLVESFNLLQRTGNLFFSIKQPNASITLRKNNEVIEQWQGNNSLHNLPVGQYQITAQLNNFTTKVRQIEILQNTDQTVSFDLEQIDGQGSFTLNTIFKDASVVVDGRKFRRKYDKTPVQIPALPYGKYEITIKKDGFKDVTKELDFNSLSQSMTVVDEYQPKTKGKAFIRSLFIPGTGHGYLDKGGRGFLYFLGSAASIGYTVKSFLDYQQNYTDYQDALQTYNKAPAGSNFAVLREDYLEYHSAAIDSRKGIEIGLMALGAVKALETLDLLFTKSNRRKLKKAKIEFNAKNNGLSMQVNF